MIGSLVNILVLICSLEYSDKLFSARSQMKIKLVLQMD